MSRICKTCGSLFKATGNEQECPTCKDPAKEVQDLAKAGVFLSWITGE